MSKEHHRSVTMISPTESVFRHHEPGAPRPPAPTNTSRSTGYLTCPLIQAEHDSPGETSLIDDKNLTRSAMSREPQPASQASRTSASTASATVAETPRSRAKLVMSPRSLAVRSRLIATGVASSRNAARRNHRPRNTNCRLWRSPTDACNLPWLHAAHLCWPCSN